MPVIDHFDFLAPVYDRFIKTKDVTRLIKLIGLPIDGRLLDAGGGTGRISNELAVLTGSTIIADLSLGMLSQASSKVGIIPLCTHTESLPFPDASFDRVIMIDALHHVCSHSQTAKELWRVVRPGGRIVIEEPNIHKPVVWLVAIFEKLALMRSHFISSNRISSLFNDPGARIFIEKQGYTAWIIVNKT
jgi:demethylmenaquinone methyltransferase/2-methoxy-6-polyprenyl-1,4-benzoquinol methylase